MDEVGHAPYRAKGAFLEVQCNGSHTVERERRVPDHEARRPNTHMRFDDSEPPAKKARVEGNTLVS